MTPSTIFRKVLRLAIPLAFWLGVWQLAALGAAGQGRQLLLPGPLAVLETLLALVGTPLFWRTAAASLIRILAGLLAGIALGAVLAVLTVGLAWADLLLTPAIRVVRATPVASVIILVFLWVKSALVPGLMAALMVLPVVWANVAAGIRETDPQLLELCQAYRFGPLKRLRLLYLPWVMPYFASGCSTALGLAWKAGVAAEVLCLPRTAIGTQVYYSKLYLEIPGLFAWTLVVILLSFGVEWAVGRLLRLMGGRRAALG